MSHDNSNFFEGPKEWSKTKNDLLRCYLPPYFSKILYTRRDTVYIDCFSGPGKFKNNDFGSPLIELTALNNSIEKCHLENKPTITSCFIDKDYANECEANTSCFAGFLPIKIVSGCFEEKIIPILNQYKKQTNIFLYVDPFGIKVIPGHIFREITNMNFSSLELLINFNSGGFFREACRIMKMKENAPEFNDGDPAIKSQQDLDDILNSSEWQTALTKYKNRENNSAETEKIISEIYCSSLKKTFKYVLSMPIRETSDSVIKYRMVFATNHPSGCLLMADNINQRFNIWKMKQPEQSLFEDTVEEKLFDEEEIYNDLLKFMKEYFSANSNTPLDVLRAEFYSMYGIECNRKTYYEQLQKLENDGLIIVTGIESKYETKHSWDEKNRKINIRYNI